MPKTDIQRFLEEEQERASKKQELIQTLLDEKHQKMQEYDEQLRLLGYQADVVARAPRAAKDGGKRQRDPDALCPICRIKGHDGRKHRSQGADKKPFTHDELVQMGLPVAS